MAEVSLAKDNLPFNHINTRMQEKIRLKELKAQKALSFTKRLNNIFSGKRKPLSYRLYFILAFAFQLRSETVLAFVHWTLYYGAANMCVGYFAIVALFEMPLMLLFTFLTMYCRKTIIEFWDCLPVMKGVALSVIFFMSYDNIFDISYTTLAFRYIFDIFSSPLPWNTCDFPGATEFCYTPYQQFHNEKFKDTWTDHCCGRGFEFEFKKCVRKFQFPQAASEYFRYKTGAYSDGFNIEWLIAIGVFWALIYLFVLLGMERMKVFIAVGSMGGIIIPILVFTLISLQKIKVYDETRLILSKSPLFNRKFWMNIAHITTKCSTPGFVVYIASLAPKDSDPLKTTVLTTIFKTIFLCIGFLGISSLVGAYMEDYNAPYKCVDNSGSMIAFAVAPHLLSSLPGYVIIQFIWFMSVVAQGGMLTVAHVLAAIDSLTDGIPFFSKHRALVSLAFILISFSFNALAATPHRFKLFISIYYSPLIILQTLIFCLTLIGIVFIYGAHRLKNDYNFAFNRPISNYWIMLWKIDTILCMTFLFFIISSAGHGFTEGNYKHINRIMMAISILPIVILFLWKYYKCLKSQNLSSFFKSSPKWRFHQHKKARLQKFFNPNKQKYKNLTLKCEHKCLMGSIHFKKEFMRQEWLLQKFSTKHNLENMGDFKFD